MSEPVEVYAVAAACFAVLWAAVDLKIRARGSFRKPVRETRFSRSRHRAARS